MDPPHRHPRLRRLVHHQGTIRRRAAHRPAPHDRPRALFHGLSGAGTCACQHLRHLHHRQEFQGSVGHSRPCRRDQQRRSSRPRIRHLQDRPGSNPPGLLGGNGQARGSLRRLPGHRCRRQGRAPLRPRRTRRHRHRHLRTLRSGKRQQGQPHHHHHRLPGHGPHRLRHQLHRSHRRQGRAAQHPGRGAAPHADHRRALRIRRHPANPSPSDLFSINHQSQLLEMNRKLRMGMVGGGRGAFIGAVHRMAANLDGKIELVAGCFSSDPEKSKLSGRGLLPRSFASLFLLRGDGQGGGRAARG